MTLTNQKKRVCRPCWAAAERLHLAGLPNERRDPQEKSLLAVRSRCAAKRQAWSPKKRRVCRLCRCGPFRPAKRQAGTSEKRLDGRLCCAAAELVHPCRLPNGRLEAPRKEECDGCAAAELFALFRRTKRQNWTPKKRRVWQCGGCAVLLRSLCTLEGCQTASLNPQEKKSLAPAELLHL